MMDIDTLYETLRKIQEPKGYYFNKDMQMTRDLLQSLLVNKERYGYMACPCRLASGNFELDKDIVCPCVYSVEDIQEYGSCYCGLYVSQKWNAGTIEHKYVPERRPPEKVLASLEQAF